MSSRDGTALTPDPVPEGVSDTGDPLGAPELDRSAGGGPGTHRIRGTDGAGIGAPCTEGTGAGGT